VFDKVHSIIADFGRVIIERRKVPYPCLPAGRKIDCPFLCSFLLGKQKKGESVVASKGSTYVCKQKNGGRIAQAKKVRGVINKKQRQGMPWLCSAYYLSCVYNRLPAAARYSDL